jgi:hypothetical protein
MQHAEYYQADVSIDYKKGTITAHPIWKGGAEKLPLGVM